MAYQKTYWESNDLITATKLNNLEDGVAALDDKTTILDTLVNTANTSQAQTLASLQAQINGISTGSVNYKGTYTSGTSYAQNDIVNYNGTYYICINTQGTTSTPPSTDWVVFTMPNQLEGLVYYGADTTNAGDKAILWVKSESSDPTVIDDTEVEVMTREDYDCVQESLKRLHTAEYIIPHATIGDKDPNKGKIVSNNNYDLVVYQVTPGDTISEITTTPLTFMFAYYVDAPSIGSISYNNNYRQTKEATTMTPATAILPSDPIVPDGVNWIAIRREAGGSSIFINTPYYDKMLNEVNTQLTNLSDECLLYRDIITTGDLNDYVETGIYVHSADSIVANAPDTGGLLIVTFTGSTICQIYFANRSDTIGSMYFRSFLSKYPGGDWVKFQAGNSLVQRNDIKIAFFGDSFVWSAVKELDSDSSTYITTRANPSITDTMSNILHCQVDNYGVSGAGYIKKSGAGAGSTDANKNIFDKIQEVDLSSYTHVIITGGDNDSSTAPVGEYTDTSNTSIMGQIYLIIQYLKNEYPNIVPIICYKNNKIALKAADGTRTAFGSFPDYYYGYTYNNASKYSIAKLHEEIDKFCEHYYVCKIDYKDFCMGGWQLEQMVGPDETHYSQYGYDLVGKYLAGQVQKFIG